MFAWKVGTILVLGLLLAPLLRAQESAPKPAAAVEGRLSWPFLVQRPIALQGQWAFVWHRFIDPAWKQLPTSSFAQVPSSWNDLTAAGKPEGSDGWGSYALQVDCPAGQSLAVEAVNQRTAARIFVNGTPIAAQGEPGTSPQTTRAAVHTRVPISREFACPLRVTVHLANYDHRVGGFLRALRAGPADQLARQREFRVAYEAALLTAYLLTGVVSLIFFALRRRERIPLMFGLFCFAMAIYTDMLGERLFLRAFASPLDWTFYTRIEYLSWMAAMALFVQTLRGLFPVEIPRRAVQVVLGLLGVAAVATLVLPPALYSYVVTPGQAIAVLVAVGLAVAMLRARAPRRTDARLLLAGMAVVLAALAADLLLLDSPEPDRKLAPIGFAFFMLMPAVVIGRRMSNALNAEERSRTLEENARLREDVERMSRHDLKTPLNSMLGVARLLRDEPGLSPRQRELVGTMQDAGLRMLEMVNLSLDLFKMEKGSYEFRPEAVDLRDVARRVLVDLQPYAQANAVTLRMQPDRMPAYVRGEELLCYSIVANLLKNAIEASGAGQEVALTLHRANPVRLEIHNPGEVSPEIADRFFEKYVTGRKRRGSGLGTYSARLMALAQHGELQLHTSPLEGTTVTLSLQALRGELPVAPPAASLQAAPEQWLSRIPVRELLLVDDDEFSLLVTAQLLPNPPFEVETTPHGKAAMDAMRTGWPDYLLLDMEMPGTSGLEVLHWLREQERTTAPDGPRCKVVMVSGHDDGQTQATVLAAGADGFIPKPVDRDRLLALLARIEGWPEDSTPSTVN